MSDTKQNDIKANIGAMTARSEADLNEARIAIRGLDFYYGANKALAVDWIKAFTDTASQRALQAKGNIPNATNLLGNSVNERAAVRSWFIPNAKNWVNVENGNVIRNMLTQILTNKLTVKQAASSASDNITSVLNG